MKNRDKIVKRQRQYDLENKEKIVNRQRQYDLKNREEIYQKRQEYRENYVNRYKVSYEKRYPNADWPEVAGVHLVQYEPEYKKYRAKSLGGNPCR